MQNEVDRSPPMFPVLQQQQQQQQQQARQGTPPPQGVGLQCIRPSTSGSSGGSPGNIQRGNPPQQQQSSQAPPQPRPSQRLPNSSQPVQSSPLQHSTRPRTASSSNILPPTQIARAQLPGQSKTPPIGAGQSKPAGTPNTPTQARPTGAANNAAAIAALILPPSPPLTRSATRSRSSLITATQSQQYVDYLLKNGGLQKAISITFSPHQDPHLISYANATYSGEVPQVVYAAAGEENQNSAENGTLSAFAALHYCLDAYTQILTNNGSVAVGTGYRSLARSLLERVESLFARDIGLPWGEVLEWVRGKRRRERLPVLPVLPVRGLLKKGMEESGMDDEAETVLGNNDGGNTQPIPAIKVAQQQPVLQKPPADGQGVHQMLAEGEKIRTKTKVEEWLEETETVLSTTINGSPVGPSTNMGSLNAAGKSNDVAGILYDALADQFHSPANHHPQSHHLIQDTASTASQEEEEERIISGIILDLLNESPPQKDLYATYLSDTPLLERTMLALRRLYPAYPPHTITRSIAALYLLLHPDLHPVLEAISRVSKGELDLLNSGRFDGFLDEKDVIPADEEKELEALEVLDGNIFRTMEKLEDEIEALHVRAEEVRRKLRVRKEAIARKMMMAGKEKDTSNNSNSSNEQFGPSLTRHNTTATGMSTTLPGKHMMFPPPPPKSDYFEGLDKESTLNPIFPDDSASNYGSRHRRRTTRKATSSLLAGDDGTGETRRNSSGSGGSGGVGAGTAAQHLMKKQLDREKDKRDKERHREKYEKERERREKEERRQAKLANAAANIGFHNRGAAGGDMSGTVGNTPPPPYASHPNNSDYPAEKGNAEASGQAPRRSKTSSREDHREKKLAESSSRERPSTSDRKPAIVEQRNSRERIATPNTAGTTVVATSPPTLLDDIRNSIPIIRERSSRDAKKKEKERKHDMNDEERPGTADDRTKEPTEKRRFFKLSKFLASDHDTPETITPAPAPVPPPAPVPADANMRPGTSGSIRPGTSYTVNTAMTGATSNTAVGPGGPAPSKSHRKERRHHNHHKAIPEAQDEDDDEKIVRHHHTTRRRSSKRSTAIADASYSHARAMEVLSEPEDMFGRDDAQQFNIGGVFSDDEDGRGHNFAGFGGTFGTSGAMGANGIKQQIMKRGLRRSSESKKVSGREEEFIEELREREKKGREREREERRERKRLEEERERMRQAQALQQNNGFGTAGPPPSHPPPPLPAPNMLPVPGDNADHRNQNPPVKLQKASTESMKRQGGKEPAYKASFSSSTGGGPEGNSGGGGVSLLGGQATKEAARAREDDEATLAATDVDRLGGERSQTPRAPARDTFGFNDDVD